MSPIIGMCGVYVFVKPVSVSAHLSLPHLCVDYLSQLRRLLSPILSVSTRFIFSSTNLLLASRTLVVAMVVKMHKRIPLMFVHDAYPFRLQVSVSVFWSGTGSLSFSLSVTYAFVLASFCPGDFSVYCRKCSYRCCPCV